MLNKKQKRGNLLADRGEFVKLQCGGQTEDKGHVASPLGYQRKQRTRGLLRGQTQKLGTSGESGLGERYLPRHRVVERNGQLGVFSAEVGGVAEVGGRAMSASQVCDENRRESCGKLAGCFPVSTTEQ